MPAAITDSTEIRVANLEQPEEVASPETAEAPPVSDSTSEPTSEPTPPAPEKPAPVSHPRALVQEALRLGAPQAYIDSVTTDELYYRVQQELDAARARNTPAPAPKAEPEDDRIDWGEGVQEEDVAAPIARVIKKQHQELRELRKLKDDLHSFKEEVKSRDQQRLFDAYDAAIDAVGPEYVDIIGKVGEMTEEQIALVNTAITAAKVDPTKDHPRAITKKVADQIKRLYGKFVKKPETKPRDQQLAASSALPTKTNGTHSERITKEQWDAAGTAAPTRRAAGEDAVSTADLVDQYLRTQNITIGD